MKMAADTRESHPVGRRGATAAQRTAVDAIARRVGLPVVLLLVGLAYLSSFRVPYLFDDHEAVADNPALRRPASFEWLYRAPKGSSLTARPVASWSFGLNALLFGHTPASYHAGNLAIHLANVTLLYLLAVRGFIAAGCTAERARAAALAAALLWGVHPLNVQAVTYLTQRIEALAALFVLMTLFAYLKSDEGRGNGWRAIAIAGPLLAAATKECGWCAPLLPLVWAWVFAGTPPHREIARRRWFYGASAAAWLWLGWRAVAGERAALLAAEPGSNAWTYFLTQPGVLTHYLRLFFFPIGQSFDYDWPLATPASAVPWLLLWGLLFLATAWSVWKRRPAGVPAAVAFLALSASLSFIALPDPACDYRFYLAGGACAILALGAVVRAPRVRNDALALAVVLAALVLGGLTFRRGVLYQSEWNIWAEAVERNPNQRRALSNLAGFCLAQGQPQRALDYLTRVESLGIPLRMRTRLHFQMGNALLDLNRLESARERYRRALETAVDSGPILLNLGHTYLRAGAWKEARQSFEQALPGLPAHADLRFDLAYVCLQSGDVAAARASFDEGRRLGGRPQPALARQLNRALQGRQ